MRVLVHCFGIGLLTFAANGPIMAQVAGGAGGTVGGIVGGVVGGLGGGAGRTVGGVVGGVGSTVGGVVGGGHAFGRLAEFLRRLVNHPPTIMAEPDVWTAWDEAGRASGRE